MKKPAILLMLLLPIYAFAQGMNEADMQRMMEQAQKAQQCMQGIDMSAMKALEQRANQMQSEVKALCAQGKRSAAEDQAMAFSREVASDPGLQKIRQCGEMMKGMMPEIPFMGHDDKDSSSGHLCDEI